MRLGGRRSHRFQVHRLQRRLVLLEPVERRTVLREQALKPSREIRPFRGGRRPGQCVVQAIAVKAVIECLLAQPARHRLCLGERTGETSDELPAFPDLLAQLFRTSMGHHDPAPHDGDAVSHQLRFAENVRCHDQGRTALLLLVEIPAHVRRRHRVEPGGRLIAEDPVGIVKRGPDQRHLLRHAAGVRGEDRGLAVRELKSKFPGDGVQESEVVEVLRRRVATIEPRLVRHHAKPSPNRIKVLWQPQPVQLDQAAIWTEDAAEASERRGLAGAVLSEKHKNLTLLDVQVHPGDCPDLAKAFAQALDADHGNPGFQKIRSFRTSPPTSRKLSRRRPQPRPGRP